MHSLCPHYHNPIGQLSDTTKERSGQYTPRIQRRQRFTKTWRHCAMAFVTFRVLHPYVTLESLDVNPPSQFTWALVAWKRHRTWYYVNIVWLYTRYPTLPTATHNIFKNVCNCISKLLRLHYIKVNQNCV